MWAVSGSKSQFGSGCPDCASENRSDNVVKYPSEIFLQKSGPSAWLKVVGSHSSKATTWLSLRIGLRRGGFACASAWVAPASIKQSKPNLATLVLILTLPL